ncbi:hypothetical protein [Prescottella agglutinans]|uniref:hypothetical protein n=1 Tax=Prescottella agglutinans TaxID=1644129 RepID=UPI00247666D1|nr:hypothetical protein [Prescottella agglutinans]
MLVVIGVMAALEVRSVYAIVPGLWFLCIFVLLVLMIRNLRPISFSPAVRVTRLDPATGEVDSGSGVVGTLIPRNPATVRRDVMMIVLMILSGPALFSAYLNPYWGREPVWLMFLAWSLTALGVTVAVIRLGGRKDVIHISGLGCWLPGTKMVLWDDIEQIEARSTYSRRIERGYITVRRRVPEETRNKRVSRYSNRTLPAIDISIPDWDIDPALLFWELGRSMGSIEARARWTNGEAISDMTMTYPNQVPGTVGELA